MVAEMNSQGAAASGQDNFEDEGRPGNRKVGPIWASTARWLAIAYAAFHLYTAGFGALSGFNQRATHVVFALILAFILYTPRKKGSVSGRVPWYDIGAILLSIALALHIFVNGSRFVLAGGSAPTNLDIFIAASSLIIILEAGRRAVSPVFSIMVILGVAYAVLGRELPDPFTHAGFSFTQILEALFLSTHGLWGVIIRVMSTDIAVFIIFGAFLVVTGGGRSFMNLAILLTGRAVGGPAKIVIVSSGLFGMISGAATANVAVTGTFTIPLMKRLGYRPEFAAGVEAAASSGGQILPPVMGAGAFVMAELLGVPYRDIIIAAAFPAILFYTCLFFGVHFLSRKQNHDPLPPSEIPAARDVMTYRALAPFFVPVIVLLTLLFMGYTPMYSCFWATVACAVIYLFVDLEWANMRQRLRKLVDALEAGGYALVMIVVLCAAASLVVGVIDYTGLGVRLTNMIVSLAGNELIVALIVAMALSIILGMGLPTVAAYLLAAAVVVPALVSLEVPALPAHLFVFYYSILASITPPVCIGVFIAAGIAAADWLKSAFIACSLALAGFIIPYMFVFNQELMLQGEIAAIALAVVSACVGVVMLAGATAGFVFARNRIWETVLLFAGAIVMIIPGAMSDLAGLVCLVIVVAAQLSRAKRLEPASDRKSA